MKDIIRQMEELQRYIDAINRELNEIYLAQNRISDIQKKFIVAKNVFNKRASELKALKNVTSSLELKLKEVDDAVEHINEKINSAQNEKELKASSNELEKINIEKESLEEQLLNNFDIISEEEESLEEEKSVLNIMEKEDALVLAELAERIERLKSIENDNRKKYDAGLALLEPQIRSRFSKLAQSKDGKVIVKMENGVCMGCNNTVPPNDMSIVNSGELHICTNCGKYLYSGR